MKCLGLSRERNKWKTENQEGNLQMSNPGSPRMATKTVYACEWFITAV